MSIKIQHCSDEHKDGGPKGTEQVLLRTVLVSSRQSKCEKGAGERNMGKKFSKRSSCKMQL